MFLCSFALFASGQKSSTDSLSDVFRSTDLIITQLSPNSFQHISYLQTNDFGLVACNGLVVRNKNEVIVFDTPTNEKSAQELINWIEKELKSKIIAIIPTHFHNDCLGSLNIFIQHKINSYGFYKTIALAKENNFTIPQISFSNDFQLRIGNENVLIKFLGEGHTRDNVVCYYSKDQILFGGCLIKELGASKGFLGDANVQDWSTTVEKVKSTFPTIKIVVPGHGKSGDITLLDYTIELFKNQD